MAELQPREGSTGDIETYHISDSALNAVEPSNHGNGSSVDTTKAAFQKSLAAMQSSAAEHYFLWLRDHLSPGELLDLLLPLAIARNNIDDHNFIYPVYTARALECIGREWTGVLFRPAIRYQARQSCVFSSTRSANMLMCSGRVFSACTYRNDLPPAALNVSRASLSISSNVSRQSAANPAHTTATESVPVLAHASKTSSV